MTSLRCRRHPATSSNRHLASLRPLPCQVLAGSAAPTNLAGVLSHRVIAPPRVAQPAPRHSTSFASRWIALPTSGLTTPFVNAVPPWPSLGGSTNLDRTRLAVPTPDDEPLPAPTPTRQPRATCLPGVALAVPRCRPTDFPRLRHVPTRESESDRPSPCLETPLALFPLSRLSCVRDTVTSLPRPSPRGPRLPTWRSRDELADGHLVSETTRAAAVPRAGRRLAAPVDSPGKGLVTARLSRALTHHRRVTPPAVPCLAHVTSPLASQAPTTRQASRWSSLVGLGLVTTLRLPSGSRATPATTLRGRSPAKSSDHLTPTSSSHVSPAQRLRQVDPGVVPVLSSLPDRPPGPILVGSPLGGRRLNSPWHPSTLATYSTCPRDKRWLALDLSTLPHPSRVTRRCRPSGPTTPCSRPAFASQATSRPRWPHRRSRQASPGSSMNTPSQADPADRACHLPLYTGPRKPSDMRRRPKARHPGRAPSSITLTREASPPPAIPSDSPLLWPVPPPRVTLLLDPAEACTTRPPISSLARRSLGLRPRRSEALAARLAAPPDAGDRRTHEMPGRLSTRDLPP